MAEFRSYSPEDVIAANLREIAERMSIVCEQEMAHLCEQSAEIVAGGGLDPDFIASLPEHRPPQFSSPSLPQNAAMLTKMNDLRAVWRSVLLCMEIRKQLEEENALLPSLFFPDQDDLTDAARGRVVYQRSSYADNAYLLFADQIPSPRAVYSHSFSAVCEEIFNGNCEYGILPLENSAEGPLNSFARLIDRYGLKIAATCDVPTTDGSRITRFALLRRSLIPPVSFEDKDLFFEFTSSLLQAPSVAALLNAAECCGLALYRFDSRLQQSVNDAHPIAHIVLRTAGGDLSAFLLYLAMEAPHCEHLGIYSHFTEQPKKGA